MGNDDSRVDIARLEQICNNIDKNVCDGFEAVNKRIDEVHKRIDQSDRKYEMSRRDIHDIDKRLRDVERDKLDKEEFNDAKTAIKILTIIGRVILIALVMLAFGAIVAAVAYFGITP